MKEESRKEPAQAPNEAPYAPPQVEEVLDAADLNREVHYAGTPGSPVIG